ncbi:GNAT family N-acetyltransferase [Ignavibacteria bacterium]|nr:GNAT family N-acetyltransferase [Bacteroidota bacterium]MCZ2131628.1 GNAT family N-acetyltransferase [Bacteroidota bacterium]
MEAVERSEIAIFPLTPERFSELARLIVALADYEHLPPPDEDAFARMREHAFADRPKFEAFLAYSDNKVAGYAIIFETYSSFLAKPTLYLEDLFVLPEFRSQKIGYTLFAFAVGEAVRRKCGRMEWQVLDWNELALSFYRKFDAMLLDGWLPCRLDENGLRKIIEKL